MVQLDSERLGNELTALLADGLAQGGGETALALALAHCAAAAENCCSGRPLACSSGCPHCCVLNVSVLLPEAIIIAGRLASRSTAAEQAKLRQRLAHHCSWSRWMDDEERISRLALCPLLDDAGNCSIHPLRPLACRGVASLDAGSCSRAFNPIISDQERTVPADLQRRLAYDDAFVAIGVALRRQGLDDRSIELGSGILAFIDTPALGDRFLAGQRLPRELWE